MQLFIKIEDKSCHSTVSVNDTTPPVHVIKQDAVYDLTVAFVEGGVQVELADGTEGRLYLRPAATGGAAHVVTGPWVKSGSGSSTTYSFTSIIVGTALAAAMAADADGKINYDAEVEWVDPAAPSLFHKSVGHTCEVRRAVGNSSAAATTAARTARTLDVATNHAELNAMGYNAYGSLQAAVDAALLLSPSEGSPVMIRCHRTSDDGITVTSLTGIRIIGLGSRITTIASVLILSGGNQWANLADCTVSTLLFSGAAPGVLNLAVDNVLIPQMSSPAKSVNIDGIGMVVSLNTDGSGENYEEDNAGHIVLSGQVMVNAVSADGDEDGSYAGNGGDLTIQGWCKVGSYSATGANDDGTLTDSSLW